jgi:hypothetical protein
VGTCSSMGVSRLPTVLLVVGCLRCCWTNKKFSYIKFEVVYVTVNVNIVVL